MLYSWDICVLRVYGVETGHPWNTNPWSPHQNISWLGHVIMAMVMKEIDLRRWQVESKQCIMSLFAFKCNYIVIIINYVIVWPFLALLLKNQDWLSVGVDGNSDRKPPECPNIFISIFWLIHWPLIRYIDRTLKKRFSVYIANRYAALIMTTYKWMKVKHNFGNNPLPARWPDPQDVGKLGESLSPLLDMVPTIPTKIIWSYGEWQPSYQKRSSCLPSWPIWKWKVYLWFVNSYKKQKQNVGKYGSSIRMEMWHVQTHHRNWPCTPPECWLVHDVTSFLDIIWYVVIQGPYVRIPDETSESARAGADISCRQHADSGATG